jgi:heme o synthase
LEEDKAQLHSRSAFLTKLEDYAIFIKFRLSSLVLFSAVIGYLMAKPMVNWVELVLLLLGGFLTTGAANGFNQIAERDIDGLMTRTQNRPLPRGRMSLPEAWILAVSLAAGGFTLLLVGTNLLCAALSISALLVYSLIYTPLKRVTPLAVFVGALPGALPPLLGWVGATGSIEYMALLLFAIQFMWQFPHFWAIAWKLEDDYRKAGFTLLPFPTGRNRKNAFQILFYSVMLIPVSALPWMFHQTGEISGITVVLSSAIFLIPAIQLYWTCSVQAATRLMFSSLIYLPVVQIMLLLNL